MSARETLRRRVGPRLIVALSTVRWPGRAVAGLRRAAGRSGRVVLFVAFDDPLSAVALLGLVPIVGQRRVDLVVEPVVERGIPGDPAVEAKRSYAVVDARRLARRSGLELSRSMPVAREDVAFLARWAEAAPAPERAAFCAAAMRELWFASDGPVDRDSYSKIWGDNIGGDPPSAAGEGALRSERRMRRRRLYDTPAAVVHGQWFFAHERLPAIERRLDELGWRASA